MLQRIFVRKWEEPRRQRGALPLHARVSPQVIGGLLIGLALADRSDFRGDFRSLPGTRFRCG